MWQAAHSAAWLGAAPAGTPLCPAAAIHSHTQQRWLLGSTAAAEQSPSKNQCNYTVKEGSKTRQ